MPRCIRRAPVHVTPNLAPLVDVVMVILIFFMLGTTFAISEGMLPTRLPTDIGRGSGPRIAIAPVVRIALRPDAGTGDCRIWVLDQPMTTGDFDGLSRFLQRRIQDGADPDGRIVIDADPVVNYQSVVSTLDACVRAGLRNIQFAVKSAAATGSTPDNSR